MPSTVAAPNLPDQLRDSHDLRLAAWGPYSKRYIGISHIPDVRAGLRFDLSVFPGIYRRSVQVPNVLWDSGYHPWHAAPDLSYYSHRHELIWRDQLYMDIAYCRLDDQATLIHCTATNRGDAPEQLSLHYAASLNFPPLEPYSTEVLQPDAVDLPAGAVWVNAMSYEQAHFGRVDPRANLTWDGQRRGEIRAHHFVDGIGLGDGWGSVEGDRVRYRVTIPTRMQNATILLRARWQSGASGKIQVEGFGNHATLLGEGHGQLTLYAVALGPLDAGEHEVRLTVTDSPLPDLEINGFVITEQKHTNQVHFTPAKWNPVPQRIMTHDHALMLKYDHVDNFYGLAWGVQPSKVRDVYAAALDDILRYKVHEHVGTLLQGEGDGHYTNVLQQPIFLKPGSRHVSVGQVCAGTEAEVRARLANFDPTPAAWEATIHAAAQRATHFTPNPSGERFLFSQERMATTVATNVVYPIRTRGTWIRHCTPGRWWDCLYTWDAGFIGLGLLELDPARAIDVLNAYLTPPGDADAAFIHHGSPVPTQFYLFAEWWNRTQDRQLLAYFYPRLRQYHRFLMGRLGSSTTRTLKSGLIRTWDYWYNSGGWDDYPPQVYARNHGLHPTVTPVINTAHAIRTAKILRMAALELGGARAEDVAEYDEDVRSLGDALQRHAWDDEVGYFSYVLHDDDGNPTTFLRHSSGTNFNMGMDGASPLVADSATPDQTRRLIEHLMTPGRMWSPIGLSTVDQRAPYFREDGYWNGAVWMAHQYFFWKALLDHGEGDAAARVAETALTLWQEEVSRSYNCYEHFVIGSGRGAGWHHFGALSAPVLNWFSTYHQPGRLSVGHNTWVQQLDSAPDHMHLAATLHLHGRASQTPTIIVTLAANHTYVATWNGAPIATHVRHPGTLELTLPTGHGRGELVVQVEPI